MHQHKPALGKEIRMRKTDSAKEHVHLCALMTALTATAILLPAPALAAGTGMVTSSASAPLLVLTRGNVRMAPAELSSMSKKAGTPLLLTKSIGTGAYLTRPARPTTAQGLHTIAVRLATHPNVLGAQIYRQSAPAYMLAPARHHVTLNGARLAGSTAPIVSYRWHQILGPNTGVANATQPSVSFLARQAATPGSSTSDPTAINPGDLTAPPKQLQCAISAASAHRVRINSPVLISKNTFMCDTGNGSTPSAGATPPDSGTPGAGTPPTDTGTPGAGTPPVDTGLPGAGTPPADTVAPPAGFNNPGPFPGMPPSSGGPGGPGGMGSYNGNCDGAVILPGGYCNAVTAMGRIWAQAAAVLATATVHTWPVRAARAARRLWGGWVASSGCQSIKPINRPMAAARSARPASSAIG